MGQPANAEQYDFTIADRDFSDREPALSGVLLLGAFVIVLPYVVLIALFVLMLRTFFPA